MGVSKTELYQPIQHIYILRLELKNKTNGHIISAMGKRQLKREQILHAGAVVMLRRGYNGTGVQEIVAAAGVPKGSFYNYFESKEQFAVEVLDAVYQPRLQRMAAALAPSDVSPLGRLRAFYRQALEVLQHQEESAYQCFIGSCSHELSDFSELIGARIDQIFNQECELVTDCLQQAVQQGELSAEMPPEYLAEAICNSWHGAMMRLKSNRTLKPVDGFLLALDLIIGHNITPAEHSTLIDIRR